MSVLLSDEEELDDEDRCELLVDLDSRCPNRAAQIVSEPWTPAAFEQRVCDEHAKSQIDYGYHYVRLVSEPPSFGLNAG